MYNWYEVLAIMMVIEQRIGILYILDLYVLCDIIKTLCVTLVTAVTLVTDVML